MPVAISRGVFFGLDLELDHPALFDLALDMARIEEVQSLLGGGSVVALGFQTGIAGRASENFQERTGDAAIGQRNRAQVIGDERKRLRDRAGILLRGAGDLI